MSGDAYTSLDSIYRDYIRAIQDKDLDKLSMFVSDEVIHNGERLQLQGYKNLIQRNIIDTEVSIGIKRLVSDDKTVAAHLIFTTKAETQEIIGIQLDGKPFSYVENVLYDFEDGKIVEVFSVFEIDVLRAHARK